MKQAKQFTGKVVSVGGTKTVIVAVDHFVQHPLYRKATRRTHRFAAHNEKTALVVGDRVRIAESKPISKKKRFIVMEKL